MLRRTILALPLAFVLGCAAAPSPGPAQSATTPPAPADAAPGAAGSSSPTAAAPPPAQDSSTRKADAVAPPSPARAATTDAPLSTQITQDDILALVQKNGEPFYRCYSLGAGATKSYRAKVTVKATVSPVGVVNAVEVVRSTTKNPKVDACVVEAFRKLVFTRGPGSGATVFTFPLSFDGMEQVQ